ncbi:MAG: PsbP-related protein [Candidatus Saccharibacteria bacterium]
MDEQNDIPGEENNTLIAKIARSGRWILAAAVVLVGFAIWLFAGNPFHKPAVSQPADQAEDNRKDTDNNSPLTYMVRKYGFEFTYPRDWTVDQKEGTVINLYRYSTDASKYDAMVTFTVIGPDSTKKGPAGDGPSVVSSENLTIDGKDAIRKVVAFGSNKQLQYEVKLDDKNLLKVQVYSYLKGSGGFEGSFDGFLDELIKTLKFTQPATPAK